MGFIPYSYRDGQPEPWEYMEASAIGEANIGMALTLSSGRLTKATGTTRPGYICMFGGRVAQGDIIPVIRVHEETRFQTSFAVAAAAVTAGSRVTIHTDASQVTATTTGGVAEVCEIRSAAAGGEVIVRFPTTGAASA